ncbi:MAG TPA: hypothetical protein PKN24_14340, partial [bacterium]|nr:hypothetical protein [bacterium]
MKTFNMFKIALLLTIGVLTIEQSAALDVVYLVAPTEDSDCNSTKPNFKWKEYQGTDRYYITVSYKSDLSDPVINHIRVESPSVQYTPASKLAYSRQIFWRVEAVYTHWSGEELKAISSIGQFKTEPSAPAAPTLTYPLNNAPNIPPLPTFKWNSASRATSYTLIIGNRRIWGHLVPSRSFTNVTSPFTLPPGKEMPEGIKYVWLVRAIGECGAITNSTEFSFTTNTGPKVLEVSCTPAVPEQSAEVQVNAVVEDDGNLDQVKLFYSIGGKNNFIPKIMERGLNNNFISSIPSGAVTARGLEIYVLATDISKGWGQSPIQSIPISLPEPGLSIPLMKSGGKDINRYRLFSVPLNLTENYASDIFVDDLGKYDKKKWRLFSLESDTTFKEYNDSLKIQHGISYLLIVADGGKNLDTGAGIVTQISENHRTLINQGWNLLGNPFNYSVPVNNIYIDGDSLLPKMLICNGSWIPLSDSLKPFQGF